MKKIALLAVAVVAMLSLVGPVGAASAKTYKASFVTKVNASPASVLKGKFKGKPFGKGRVTQTEVSQGTYVTTLKSKRGKVKIRLTGRPVKGKIRGKWKVINGTKKYKRIRGGGKLVSAGTAKLKFRGKVKY